MPFLKGLDPASSRHSPLRNESVLEEILARLEVVDPQCLDKLISLRQPESVVGAGSKFVSSHFIGRDGSDHMRLFFTVGKLFETLQD